MENPRIKAYKILFQVIYEGGYSNIAINHGLRNTKFSNQDRAFITELVYGVLEKKFYLEYVLQKFSKTPLKKLSKEVKLILLMGLYQIRFMNSVTDFAAVDESVKISKKLFPKGGGFVNGVLRNVLRDPNAFEIKNISGIKRLSIEHNVSSDIAELLVEQNGIEEATRILAAMGKKPNLYLRTNLLKTTRDKLEELLTNDGVTIERVPTEPVALSAQNLKRIEENSSYQSGLFTVQDLSSMQAVRTLDPQKGEKILDLCACPGGKTTFAAELMENEGAIDAQDISANKLKLVEQACKRLGITIVRTREWDATKRDDSQKEQYDRVLIDAPCSGLGIIRKKPEIRYKTKQQIESLYDTQQKILESGASYVKRGGILVYSTCTINRRENEEQVQDFLSKYEFELLEEKQLRFQERESDGFYIAKMRKS